MIAPIFPCPRHHPSLGFWRSFSIKIIRMLTRFELHFSKCKEKLRNGGYKLKKGPKG
jgi:hypothetical protein